MFSLKIDDSLLTPPPPPLNWFLDFSNQDKILYDCTILSPCPENGAKTVLTFDQTDQFHVAHARAKPKLPADNTNAYKAPKYPTLSYLPPPLLPLPRLLNIGIKNIPATKTLTRTNAKASVALFAFHRVAFICERASSARFAEGRLASGSAIP